MASIGSILPTATTAGTSAAQSAASTSSTGASSASSSSGSSGATDPLANEGTFLQLLVAQLKNQDPSQPMDGTTFVTQLAQFSTLEQELASRKDLDTISTDLSSTSAAGTASGAGTATTGSGTTTGSTGTTSTTAASGA